MYQFDSDEWWANRNNPQSAPAAPAAPVAAPQVNPFAFAMGGMDTGKPAATGNMTPADWAAMNNATPMPKPGMPEAEQVHKPMMVQPNTQASPMASSLGRAANSGADYFMTPYQFGGQSAAGKLDNFQMQQVANAVAGGSDYNTAVMRFLGDGIGTGAVHALDGSGRMGTVYDLGSGQINSAAGGRSSGGGGGSSSGLNPYLTQAQQALTSQVTDNLRRNILPGLSSAAMASGNFGGSRQGVIEANALNDANRQIANGMANLSFQAYESDANRGLQQQQIDNSYNLGMGNLGLGQMNATNNFYTAQRGQDLQSTALGAQLMNQGNQGYLNQGQGMFNLGSTYQNAPWQTIGSFGNTLSPWGNQTGTTTGTPSSNPWASALGGALGGAQLGSMFGGSGMGPIVNSGGVSGLPSMYLR